MTKFSDNDSPSLLFSEQGSTPTSPAASKQRLFIRTSDHTLCYVNSSGTVTQVATATTLPKELGAAEITSSFTTTSGSAVDVTGLTVTVTIGSLPVDVIFFAPEMRNNNNGGRAIGFLVDVTGSTNLLDGIIVQGNSNDGGAPVYAVARVSPASGSRTYKVQLAANTAGTSAVRAGASNKAFIRVVERAV
jgi:hypothetical protein